MIGPKLLHPLLKREPWTSSFLVADSTRSSPRSWSWAGTALTKLWLRDRTSISTYLCLCDYVFTCMHVYIYIYLYVCMYAGMYVCVYSCMYVYTCLSILCIYTRISINTYTYRFTCVYIYIYIHTYTHVYMCIYIYVIICVSLCMSISLSSQLVGQS